MSRLLDWYARVFNIKFAIISAIFNGGLTAMQKSFEGHEALVSAAIAQAFASFFATGVTARVVQHFSPIANPIRSYILGSVVPASMTFAVSLAAHLLNGTHDPVMSSFVPATLVSFTTSFVTNWITRRGYLRPRNYPSS